MTERSFLHSPRTGTSELVDVVNLVMQAIWADIRRSPHSIEPSQWATLRLIAAGPSTMSELARHKAVSLPTISKSVDMLVRRGWVERFVDDADRRQTLVRLTTDGRRVLADCRRQVEDLLEAKLAVLTAEEREPLTASLRTLRDALRRDVQWSVTPESHAAEASAQPALTGEASRQQHPRRAGAASQASRLPKKPAT